MTVDNQEKFLHILQKVIEVRIPFNQLLGFKVERLSMDEICISFSMQPNLVGHFVHGILHGGVIASVLDVIGGVTAFLGVTRKLQLHNGDDIVEKFSELATIDMRIDYLRPGKGEQFFATGSILRTGSRVAVTRMELHNQEQILIAVGTGTYIVS